MYTLRNAYYANFQFYEGGGLHKFCQTSESVFDRLGSYLAGPKSNIIYYW